MLRNTRPVLTRLARCYSSSKGGEGFPDTTTQPALRQQGAKRIKVDDILEGVREKTQINTLTNVDEVTDISGIPDEHRYDRKARIFKPARNSGQAGWNNTLLWKIELDLQKRWDNPLIGYASSADPLSNVGMQLDFPSEQDAITFCEKNNWEYVVEKTHEREIKPKAYGSNFHWNKRSRVSTK